MTAEEILAMVFPNGVSIIPDPVYECPKCKDTGYVMWYDDDRRLHSYECECSIKKRALQRIERSGLKDLLKRYSFDSYQTDAEWQRKIKSQAENYLNNGKGSWFFISGKPGSGKTHICTAIVGEMIQNKGRDVHYMIWREVAPRLKANVVEDRDEYEREMFWLKRSDVLYIDDFFKGRVTDGDINLAFELLNDRYNSNKQTVISGEKSLEEILNLDEAIGSRIYERSKKGFCIRTADEDWRLK